MGLVLDDHSWIHGCVVVEEGSFFERIKTFNFHM